MCELHMNFLHHGGMEEVGSLLRPFGSLLGTLRLSSGNHYTKPHISEDIKHSGVSMGNECKVPGFIVRMGGLSGL